MFKEIKVKVANNYMDVTVCCLVVAQNGGIFCLQLQWVCVSGIKGPSKWLNLPFNRSDAAHINKRRLFLNQYLNVSVTRLLHVCHWAATMGFNIVGHCTVARWASTCLVTS